MIVCVCVCVRFAGEGEREREIREREREREEICTVFCLVVVGIPTQILFSLYSTHQ